MNNYPEWDPVNGWWRLKSGSTNPLNGYAMHTIEIEELVEEIRKLRADVNTIITHFVEITNKLLEMIKENGCAEKHKCEIRK